MHGQRRLIPVMVAALVLNGCSAMSPGGMLGGKVLPPVDPGDTCEMFRQPLREAQANQYALLTKWAAAGVLAGTTAGILCAMNKEKAAVCAGIGAAILLGSVVGGYIHEKSAQASTKQDLERAIDGDSSTFRQSLGTVGMAAHNLTLCRREQIANVSLKLEAKRVDKAAALTELQSIEKRLGDDQIIINAFLDESEQRTDMQLKARASASSIAVDSYRAGIETGQVASAPAVEDGLVEPPAPKKAAPLPKVVSREPVIQYAQKRVNVRSQQTTASSVVTTLDGGTPVTVNGKAGAWLSVSYLGTPGFIAESLLGASRPETKVAALEFNNQKGKDETQRAYNMQQSVKTQVASDMQNTNEILERVRMTVTSAPSQIKAYAAHHLPPFGRFPATTEGHL